MRKILVLALLLIAISYAQPARACMDCAYDFLWPWMDDCANCVETNCGWVLCHLEQQGDDICVLQGDDCNEGGKNCPPPSYTSLDTTWRLARVRISTPWPQHTVKRAAIKARKG
jgi:hypothetical protein